MKAGKRINLKFVSQEKKLYLCEMMNVNKTYHRNSFVIYIYVCVCVCVCVCVYVCMYQFSSVQSLSTVWLFATPWTAAFQASLSITNSWSLLKLMSIKSVMPSNHLILCHPLLLLPSIFPSIRVFSSDSVLHIRWPKYWSFSFSIVRPMNIHKWFPLELD